MRSRTAQTPTVCGENTHTHHGVWISLWTRLRSMSRGLFQRGCHQRWHAPERRSFMRIVLNLFQRCVLSLLNALVHELASVRVRYAATRAQGKPPRSKASKPKGKALAGGCLIQTYLSLSQGRSLNRSIAATTGEFVCKHCHNVRCERPAPSAQRPVRARPARPAPPPCAAPSSSEGTGERGSGLAAKRPRYQPNKNGRGPLQ
jgi:hypothetical protein